MHQLCNSCGLLLTLRDTKGAKDNFCKRCLNEKDEVKTYSEIQAGQTAWIPSWQPAVDRDTALQRASYYMIAMPH